MTAPPRLIFEVALELGPLDTPGPSDWTDLSDRVMAYSDGRGRANELDEFRPAVATIVLDNFDRQLDPSVVGALNELAVGKGLPGCPARVLIDWDGSEWEWLVGVLGDEPWIPSDAPHGSDGTVTVEVVDITVRDAGLGLAGDLFQAAMLLAGPSWWGRKFTDLGSFQDWSPNNDPGSFLWGTSPGLTLTDPLVPGTDLPSMRFHEMAVELPSALDGPVDDFSVFLVTLLASTQPDQILARVPSTATTPGWRIAGNASGTAVVAAFFAPGGSLLHSMSLAITGPVILTVEGGVEAVLSSGSASVAWTSGSVPTGWEGEPRFGDPSNAQTPAFAEMAYWADHVLDPAVAEGLADIAKGSGWAAVPTLDLRIAAWQTLAGSSATVQIHPTSLPQLTVVEEVPSTLGEAFQQAAEAGRGATYALRDGTIRVRTIEALTDATLSAHYADPIANLTDEPSPAGTPVPVRRSPVKWSGVRAAEVVNVSTVTYHTTWGDSRVSVEDAASIAQFGRRERTWQSDFAEAEEAAMIAIATEDITRYSSPRRRMDAVTVEPTLDGVLDPEDAITFMVEDLELEKAVDVTWTPPGGSPETVTVQVQGFDLEWSPERWTVTLALAES